MKFKAPGIAATVVFFVLLAGAAYEVLRVVNANFSSGVYYELEGASRSLGDFVDKKPGQPLSDFFETYPSGDAEFFVFDLTGKIKYSSLTTQKDHGDLRAKAISNFIQSPLSRGLSNPPRIFAKNPSYFFSMVPDKDLVLMAWLPRDIVMHSARTNLLRLLAWALASVLAAGGLQYLYNFLRDRRSPLRSQSEGLEAATRSGDDLETSTVRVEDRL